MKKNENKIKQVPDLKTTNLLNEVNKTPTDLEDNFDFRNVYSLNKHMSSISKISKDMVELFPDIELAMEIIISLIISPNDIENENLIYELSKKILPSDVRIIFKDTLETYINKEFKINDNVEKIVKESLYTEGSYVELNLSEKYIKENIIENSRRVRQGNENLTVSSNLYKIFTKDKATNKIRSGVESRHYNNGNRLILSGLESAIRGEKSEIDMNNNKTLIKKIKSEFVIPVTSKNDVSIHYGYFIILNEKGDNVTTDIAFTDKETEAIITSVNKKYHDNDNVPHLEGVDGLKDKILKEKIEAHLKDKEKLNSIDIDFSMDNNLLLNVFDTIIKNEKIEVIYLPEELVSYYAVDFRENGTGKSLLEKVTTLTSIRSILMFTNLLSYIKSSITTTEIKVDLDPDDPNYKQNLRKIVTGVINNRKINLPIGMLNVNSFVDWSHQIGFSVNAKHPGLPDNNIEVNEKENSITPIDIDLIETIDDQILRALYVTPELLDESKGSDLATTVRNNRVILSKRINKLRKKYNVLLTKDIIKKTLIDERLKNNLKSIIENNLSSIKKFITKNNSNINNNVIKQTSNENLIDAILFMSIKDISVTLPNADIVDETDLSSEKVSVYSDMLDTILDNLFSSDVIVTENSGELSNHIDTIKKVFKTMLLKKYVSDNNLLPDFNNMFVLNEDGKPNDIILEDFNQFLETLGDLTLPFIKGNTKIKEKLDKKINKIGEEDPDEDDLEDDDIDDDLDNGETPKDNEEEIEDNDDDIETDDNDDDKETDDNDKETDDNDDDDKETDDDIDDSK